MSALHSDTVAKDGVSLGDLPDRAGAMRMRRRLVGAVGRGVLGWSPARVIGVGWFPRPTTFAGSPCRRGYLVDCRNLRIPGVTYDGGYSEAMVAPADALALIPDELSPATMRRLPGMAIYLQRPARERRPGR